MRKIVAALVLLLTVPLAGHSAVRGLPPPTIPDCLGVNIHFTGDNEKEVKMIADAGFRLARMDFLWQWVEKEKGKYDFSIYDGLMAALDRHGIRAMFIFDYGNTLYPNSDPLVGDEARVAFAAFARAAATHFRDRGIIWEIWNEPNYHSFSGQDYAKLALVVGRAVHEADPHSTVLGPTSATIDMGFLSQVFSQGALKELDAVTVHPYRGGGSPPETAAPELAAAYELIRQHQPAGKTIPLLSGEWGYTMVGLSAEQQAQYLVRMFLSNLACNVNYSIWYDWSDDGLDPNYGEHHFGTVYNDLKPKPAYYAMQTLSRQLAGCQVTRRVQVDSQDDYILILRKGKSHKLAVWTIGQPHEITLPMDVSTITLTDMYGKRKPGVVTNGGLKLALDRNVTYVDVLGSSDRLAIEEAWSATAAERDLSSAARLPVRCTFTNSLKVTVEGSLVCTDPTNSRQLASRAVSIEPGDSVNIVCDAQTLWSGVGPIPVLTELRIEGMNAPIRRTVQFDTKKFLTATAAPPLGDSLQAQVQNPSGEPFIGKLVAGGEQGSGTDSGASLNIAKGQESALITLPVAPASAGRSALKLTVFDPAGKACYAPEPFTYTQVTPFDDASKLSLALDGNGGVPVTTKQTTVPVPEPLAGATNCTKIDYTFGNGWRYVKFNSNPVPTIEGKPRYVGIWVYGNGSTDLVCPRFQDATDQAFQPISAKLDFKGWRFVTWSLDPSRLAHWMGANDGAIHWPLRWDSQVMIDSNQKEHSGSIHIGPIWLIY